MAVAFDATATAINPGATGATLSWTHPGATSPTNYLAIVGITFFDATLQTLDSVTFGGQAMTKIIQDGAIAGQQAFLWGLINPPTGSQTVLATWSTTVSGAIGGSCTFTGANQATGWHNATSIHQIGPVGSLSLVVTSAVNEMTMTDMSGYTNGTETFTTNQTQRWNGQAAVTGAGDTASGAATVTHTWTGSIGINDFAIVGLSIIAAAVGATTLPIFVQC